MGDVDIYKRGFDDGWEKAIASRPTTPKNHYEDGKRRCIHCGTGIGGYGWRYCHKCGAAIVSKGQKWHGWDEKERVSENGTGDWFR